MDFKNYITQLEKIYEDSEKEFFEYVTTKLKEWDWKYFYLIIGPDEYNDGMSEGINDWVMTNLNETEVLDDPDYPEFAFEIEKWTEAQGTEISEALSGIDVLIPNWESLPSCSLVRITQEGKVQIVGDFDE